MHMQHTSQPASPHVRGNPSVSSLVSSSTSSTVSSILPHGNASVSSQSDVTSDHISLQSHSSLFQPLRGPYRDHSMGQVYSSDPSPPPTLQKSSVLGQAAVVTGSKLKRAFAARRKKSETVPHQPFFSNPLKYSHNQSRSPSPSILPQPSPAPSIANSSRSTLGTKLHIGSNVFGRKSSKSSPISEPPIPPPKPISPKVSLDKPLPVLAYSRDSQYNSIIPVTPGMTSALNFMRYNEQEQSVTSSPPFAEQPAVDIEKPEHTASSPQKDLWRKSDSTMSHHTMRPGGTVGNRTPRPVSMAESLQSNHTIVPMNKRISALISDADFAPPEETDVTVERTATSSPRRAFSSSSLKSNNRLSASLTFGARLSATKSHTQPLVNREWKPSTAPEVPPITPMVSRQSSTLTRADASGIIAPSSDGSQSTGSNIRGRLAAWTGTPSSRRPSQSTLQLPQTPQSTPDVQYPTFRNTAISITSSFSPAAGFARRAVERMGKAWGGMHSNHNPVSSSAPSAFPPGGDLGRVSSRQSSVSPVPSKSKRRTPNAPSGAWSISSSTTSSSRSTSESDIFSMSAGPTLGICLRGPLDSSGFVFGKPLYMGVRASGPAPRVRGRSLPQVIATRPELRRFEERKLSALVVRCAQHLMVWGVQEEGLFRVNGRPYHISKLRAEFDTGADYELVECDLGDVDPHAVASVFKAYLRELPEPVLTRNLSPFFEAAIQAEQQDIASSDSSFTSSAESAPRGPALPSNPRYGNLPIRKPPSLSTLAMPKLSSIRPASKKLLDTIATLIDKLPEENRDLLLTITELIKATANGSKETRMPLSNLLLVFCPSLNMNPPLLRVLCEGEGIWDGPPVFDTKQGSVMSDIQGAQEEAVSDQDDQSVQLPSLIGDSASSSSSFVNVSVRSLSEASVDQAGQGQERLLPCSSSDSLPTPADKEMEPQVDFPVVEPESPSSLDQPASPSISRRLRPKLDNLVQFPSYGAPASPVLTTRKSLTSLSLPSFGFKSPTDQDSPGSASPTASSLRDKLRHRPSLHYLIPKRSSSALNNSIFPPISAPIQASSKLESKITHSSSISAHSYTLPSIEPSPWSLNMEDHPQPLESRQDSSSSTSSTTGGTPIADLYQTPAGSIVSLNMTESSTEAIQRTESSDSDSTFCSLPSPSRVEFLDSESDADWTRSVLIAADMDVLGRDP